MLREITKDLPFEPFLIDHLVDPRGRYQLDLEPQFPFKIKLYSFVPVGDSFPMNWHERLEIFVPLAGKGRFRMGDRVLDFEAGDILVVDNLKLHGLVEFRGPDRRAITITFNSALIYNLGSPMSDFVYLLPFHWQGDLCPVVRSSDPEAASIYHTMEKLLRCYFDKDRGRYAQAGCKAYLLEILFQLSVRFRGAEIAQSEYMKQQERSRQLGQILDYLQQHYARSITVRQASSMVGMSDSRFMRFFKQATGTTFISYLTQVRLAHACELLRSTDLAVGEIAARVGVPDQAYFDRKFRQHLHTSPRSMRAQSPGATGS